MKIILSIVIANYNYGRFLNDAILSIFSQCDEPVTADEGVKILPITGCDAAVELIVCDAASADNSVDIIKRCEGGISWWCTEKDGGQSAAFNKGFRHAHGKYLTWLNADDLYLAGTFAAFYRAVQRHPDAEWISGNDLHFSDADKRISFVAWGPHWNPKFLKRNHAQSYPFGPTSFVSADAYRRIGPIDESLHLAMDHDYWIRLTMAGISQYRLNHVCWAFRHHEEAKSTGAHGIGARGPQEKAYYLKKTGYTYVNSIKNPWYVLWLLSRVIDGSLFVRIWKKRTIVGRFLDMSHFEIV